jgi:lipoprotein-anchoring transpeptidase ErfK/SrfK
VSETPIRFTRRSLLGAASVGMASAALAGCTSTRPASTPPSVTTAAPLPLSSGPAADYAAMEDGGFSLPAIPYERINPRFYRQSVLNTTGEPAGVVVVDTSNHFLYYTMPFGQAMRYGVGLGRAGFEWSGRGEIEWKQAWPRWFPPDEMIDRQPELEPYRAEYDPATRTWLGGMAPGLQNPLGARAHYIYQDGKDTLYRIHGSPEWNSIGTSVSSGCVRMINQDVIDLYNRVPEKTPVVVTSGVRVA